MDKENLQLETSLEDAHDSTLNQSPERAGTLNLTQESTQIKEKDTDIKVQKSTLSKNSVSSPSQVSPEQDIDFSGRGQSKFSLQSQTQRNSMQEPVRNSHIVMASQKAIQEGRSRYKNVAKLYEQQEQLGHIVGYDKVKIEMYLSGKQQAKKVIDIGGEEKLANLRVKLVKDKPLDEQIMQHDEDNIKSRAKMKPRYDDIDRNLHHGPWSQRGRGSVNASKIDADLSKYQVQGKQAKMGVRPDLTQYAFDTFRNSQQRTAVNQSSIQQSFDPYLHSTTTESPRIGQLQTSKQLQMRKIFSMQGSQQTTKTGEGNVLSQHTTTNNSTSIQGQSHIGKITWMFKPSMQHKSSHESLQRLGNLSAQANMPKIRFGQKKTDQIHANIKAALNQELKIKQTIPRTSHLPFRKNHQVLSGGIFDSTKQSLSDMRDGPVSPTDHINPMSNISKLSETDMPKSRNIQSRRYQKNPSQWKSVTDKQQLFSPTSPNEEAFFSTRGKLNEAIQNLGVPEIKQRVLMSQQSSLENDNNLMNQLPFYHVKGNRQIMSQEAKFRLEKIKKPYQPQMSIQQMNDSIKSKARAVTNSLKHRKQRSTMPLNLQLLALRNQAGKLADFYTNSKLQVVTEDEVKAGMGGFQVLIDPMKIKEISAEIDKQRKRRIKQSQQRNESTSQNLKSGVKTLEGLGQQLVNQEQLDEKQKRAERPPTYMTAAMVDGLEDPANIKAEMEAFQFEQKLKQVEKQEMEIINKLYKVHFPGQDDDDKDKLQSKLTQQTGQITNNNNLTLETQTKDDNSDNDPLHGISTEGQEILNEHIEKDKFDVTVNSKQINLSTIQNNKTNLATQGDDINTSLDTSNQQAKEDLDQMKDRQQVKYVQYVPKKLGHDHVDLDAAIKSLYSMNVNNISPSSPRPRFGRQNQIITGNDIKLHTNYDKVKGFMYGPQTKKCQLNHIHSRECSKIKDLDIANLQTLAFQFMLLQKPEFSRGIASDKAQASFFPSQSKLSMELNNAYKEIEMMRKMSMMSQIKIDSIFDKFKRSNMLGITTNISQVPGQEVNPNEIPSGQRLQYYVKQLIESQEGTSALEEKLRQIVNTINRREQSILRTKIKKQSKDLRQEPTRQQQTTGETQKNEATTDRKKSRLETSNHGDTFTSEAWRNQRENSMPPTSAQHSSVIEQYTSPLKVVSPMSTDTRILGGTDGLSPLRPGEVEMDTLRIEQSGIDEIWKQYQSDTKKAQLEMQARSFSGEKNHNSVVAGEPGSPSKRKSVQVKYSKNNSNSVPGSMKGNDQKKQETAEQVNVLEQNKGEVRPPTTVGEQRGGLVVHRGERQSDVTLPTQQSQRIDSDPNHSMAGHTVVQHSKDQSMLSNVQNSAARSRQPQPTFSNSYQMDQMLADPKFATATTVSFNADNQNVDQNAEDNMIPPQEEADALVEPELQTMYIRPQIKTTKSQLQCQSNDNEDSIDEINNATDSPLSNENIRILTQKEHQLNKKYISRILQEQRQAQAMYKEHMRELSIIQREISIRKQMGTKNKMVWKSPFAHRENLKAEKKSLIAAKRVENMEKFPHYPPTQSLAKSYHQWSLTDLNKRDIQLKQIALEHQLQINGVLQALNLLKQKEMDLRVPSIVPQKGLAGLGLHYQESSASPQRIKYYENKYPAEESIAELAESEHATTHDHKGHQVTMMNSEASANQQKHRIRIPIAGSDKDIQSRHADPYMNQLTPNQGHFSFDAHEVLKTNSHDSTIRRNANHQMTSDKKLSGLSSMNINNNSVGRQQEGMDKVETSKSPSGSFQTLYEVRMKMNTSPVTKAGITGTKQILDKRSPQMSRTFYQQNQQNPQSYENGTTMQNVPQSFGQIPPFGLNLRKTVEFQKQQNQFTHRDTSKRSKVSGHEKTGSITYTQDEPSKVKLGPAFHQKRKKQHGTDASSNMDKTHRLIHDLSSPKNKPNKTIRKSPINNLDLPQKIFDEERDLLGSQRQKRKPSHLIGSNRHSYLPKRMLKPTSPAERQPIGFKTITPSNQQIECVYQQQQQQFVEGYKLQRPTALGARFSPRQPNKNQINVVMQTMKSHDQNESFGEARDQQPQQVHHGQFRARLGSRGSNLGYRKKLPHLQNQTTTSLSPQRAIFHNRTGTLGLIEQGKGGTIMVSPQLEMQPASTDNTHTRELSQDFVSSGNLDINENKQAISRTLQH